MAMGRSLAGTLRAGTGSTNLPRTRRVRQPFGVEGLERRVLLDGSDLALYRPAYATSFDPAQQNQQSIYLPDQAFDADPATRWSAGTNAAGTFIQADLGATFGVTRVRLHWEAARAVDYKVQVSDDRAAWRDIKSVTDNTQDENDWTGLAGSGRYVRVYPSRSRSDSSNYSLYAFEVYGNDNAALRPLTTSATASSTQSGFPAQLAFDNDSSSLSRWSAGTNGTQWVQVDLGSVHEVSRVRLNWEGAWGVDYKVQAADAAAGPWTDTAVVTNNASGGWKDYPNLSGVGRFVRVLCTRSRTDSANYSLYDVEVYGRPDLGLRQATESSHSISAGGQFNASAAFDENSGTRWATGANGTQWAQADLGGTFSLSRVRLNWHTAYAVSYKLQLADSSGGPWNDITTVTGNATAGWKDYTGLSGSGRFVRVLCTQSRADTASYSVFDVQAFGTPLTRPAAPGNLTRTNLTATQIDLSWASVAGATGYRVERSTGGGAWATAGTSAAGVTAFSDTGRSPATAYAHRVVATNAAGEGASSTLSTTTPPAAPASLTATPVSSSQVNLSWTASTGATSYKVSRSPQGAGTWTLLGEPTATTFSDTTASAATAYDYRVIATGAGGDSAAASSSATTLGNPPAAPDGLTRTNVTATQIDLTWSAAAGATGYRIERSTNGGAWATAGTTTGATTFQDTGLTAGTAYAHRVVATNAAGESSASAALATTTVPAAPSNLAATASSASQIDLTWADVAGESGYAVERSDTGAGNWTQVGTTAADVTTYNDTGLGAGTTRYYRVKALNGGGESAPSASASATTQTAAPAAPSGVTATASATGFVQVAWADNSTNESGFRVEQSTAGAAFTLVATVPANTTTYTFSEPDPSTSYVYQVSAENAGGTSAPAASTPISTVALFAPGAFTAELQPDNQTVRISFKDNAPNETGFSLVVSTDGATFNRMGPWFGGSPGRGLTVGPIDFIDTSAGMTYTFAAIATGGVYPNQLESERSNGAAVTTPPLAAPSALRVTGATDTTVDLSWTNSSAEEVVFRVWKSTDGTNFTPAGGTGGTSFTAKNLTPLSRYWFKVHANGISRNGTSDFSGTSEASTEIDLAIDSDNDNGVTAPTQAAGENSIEDDADKPGKVIEVGGARIPMILEVSPLVDAETALVRFTYNLASAEAPANPLKIYDPNGRLVLPGHVYRVAELGAISNGLILRIEAVAPSAADGDQRIVVEMDAEALGVEASFDSSDAVRVTLARLDSLKITNLGSDFKTFTADTMPDRQNDASFVHVWVKEVDGSAEIRIDAIHTPQTAAVDNQIFWDLMDLDRVRITTPHPLRNFGGAEDPVVKLTPASDAKRTYFVSLGFDDNNNRLLDANEITREAKVHVVKMTLREVDFTGEEGKTIDIKPDDTGIPEDIEWKNEPNPLSAPLAYTVNSRMSVKSAIIDYVGPVPGVPVKWRGRNSDGFNFSSKELDKSMVNGGATLTATHHAGDKVFGNAIDAVNAFQIAWEISLDGEYSWLPLETTNNPLYIALGPSNTVFRTVIDIACRNAKGKTTAGEALSEIWKDFAVDVVGQAPSVARADGTVMKYWGPAAMQNQLFSVAEIVSNADGRCEAWARLLRSALDVQGIAADVFVIGPNVPAAPAVPGTTFRKTSIEIKSIPGQGNASPPTLFENHAVVQLVGASAGLAPAAIFDPSYGQKYDSGTTLNASRVMWEDASIMRFVYEYANGHEEYHPNGPALETTWQLQ